MKFLLPLLKYLHKSECDLSSIVKHANDCFNFKRVCSIQRARERRFMLVAEFFTFRKEILAMPLFTTEQSWTNLKGLIHSVNLIYNSYVIWVNQILQIRPGQPSWQKISIVSKRSLDLTHIFSHLLKSYKSQSLFTNQSNCAKIAFCIYIHNVY